jgi:hypothetical protein
MSTYDPAPLLHFEPNFRWRNKHRNVEVTAERLYNVWNRTAAGREPSRQRWRAGLNALRQIVVDAERAGQPVRAYGGAWSLSEAPCTAGYLVNTKPLNYLSIGLSRRQVLAPLATKARRLVFAQCGIHVMELHRALEGAGLALPTSGASNGQTLAGAIATGTHGAALSVGAMQDFVRGIHLVVEGGRHLYVEPASSPVVSSEFVATLGAEHHRSDALFRAALVSFGSFGLVHGFLFEAAPLYELLKYRFRVDHATALSWFDLDFPRMAREANLPPASPYHFEVVFDPYRMSAGQRGAFVTTMYQVPPRATREQPTPRGFEPGDDVMQLIARLTDLTAAPVPTLVSNLMAAQLTDVSGEQATPGQTFSSTNIRGPVLSAELGVSLAQAQLAVRALVDEAQRRSFPGLVAVRFLRGSEATLAFTKYHPVSCTIELPGAGGRRALDFFETVWPRLDAEDVHFTLHWGQCGDFSAPRVRRMYGNAADAWVAQRRALLSSAGRRLFSNPLLDRCGLGT